MFTAEVLDIKAFLHVCRNAFCRCKTVVYTIALLLAALQPLHGRELMLARGYTGEQDVCGWLMSEKLDGVRGYWTGSQLLTRSGRVLQVPPFFIRHFPPFALEGELWGGRGTFAQTVSIIKHQDQPAGWQQLQFAVFDVPEVSGGFSHRLRLATDWFTDHPTRYAFVISQIPLKDNTQLEQELQRIERAGGEGLIIRKPGAFYRSGRSSEILKVKSRHDAEAVVIGYHQGKGRNAGRLGSLEVSLRKNGGIHFRIGAGLTDDERENPVPIGTVITFTHYGWYPSGIPRFPSFLRVRDDAGW